MDTNLILCLDIGGTHISAAIIDVENMDTHPATYFRAHVDSHASKEAIIKEWNGAINRVVKAVHGKVQGCVVSIPGPFDYKNGISQMDGMNKYQEILGMDVKAFLSKGYDINPDNILFYNDANAFLLGEIYHYCLEKQLVVGLTMGTGLGSSFYDGSTVRDLNYGSASFRNGIVEDYISTRGILHYLKGQGIDKYNNVKEIMDDKANANNRELAIRFLSDVLVDFIQEYIAVLKPNQIIIGGSIAKSHALFLKEIQQKVSIPIRPASFDELNLFYGMTLINKI